MRRWFLKQNINKQTNATAQGVVLFMIGLVFMTAMDAAAKWLVVDNVHVIQLLFIRSCIIVLLLIAYYASRHQLILLKPKRVLAQSARGLIGFLAPFAFFYSLKTLPLTAANVVFFSSIFIITLGSAVFLKERVGIYRWSAVAVGYIGVFIAINPRGEGELLGYVMVLLASAIYSFLFISGKMLGSTESSASLVLFYNLGVGAVSAVWLPTFWVALTLNDYIGILLVSILAVIGQYCATQAFSLTEASLLAPLNYTVLVLAIAFDWVLWQTIPAAQTMLGAVIIVTSSAVVLYRQRQHELSSAGSENHTN